MPGEHDGAVGLQGEGVGEVGDTGDVGGDQPGAVVAKRGIEFADDVVTGTAKSLPVPATSVACPATTILPSGCTRLRRPIVSPWKSVVTTPVPAAPKLGSGAPDAS